MNKRVNRALFSVAVLMAVNLIANNATAAEPQPESTSRSVEPNQHLSVPAENRHGSQSNLSQNNEPQNDSLLLAQLGERSKSIHSMAGRFVQQKHIAVLPAPLNSTGRFHFEQGKGVVWEVLTPVQQKVELTPNGIRFGNEQADNHMAAQQAGVEIVANIFMGVIAGELDGLKDYFAVTASGSSDQWTLHLLPHSANLAAYIKHIELQGSEFTEQLEIAEANGDRTHITFTTDSAQHSHGHNSSGHKPNENKADGDGKTVNKAN